MVEEMTPRRRPRRPEGVGEEPVSIVERRSAQLGLAMLALAWTACATSVKSLPAGYAGGGSTEAVVIGRVLTGLQKPVIFASAARLKVEHANGEDYEIVCDQPDPNSYFFVALPPGSYRLKGVTYGQMEGSLGGRLEVAERVNYVGDLTFVLDTRVGTLLAGAVLGALVGEWRVMDQYEDAVLLIQRRYPQLGGEVVRTLIELP
jgi:hypothetical protein